MRRFRTTNRRAVGLAGWWDFMIDPDDKGKDRAYFRDFPEGSEPVWVPSSWNANFRWGEYFGPAWYRLRFTAPWTGTGRFAFDRVCYSAETWLDGRSLGEHEGEYLPFSFDSPLKEGLEHELVMRVDNRHSEKSLPKHNVDWFHYGGIQAAPALERIGDVTIENLCVRPFADGRYMARALVRNRGEGAFKDSVEFAVCGEKKAAGVTLEPGEAEWVKVEGKIENARPWSMEDPHLETASAAVGGDVRFERFGFREIGSQGNRLTLNGRVIYLKGGNRHDEHPDFGYAVPPQIAERDLDILKELGGNVIRSHYTPQEYVLDLCDERGIMYFNEVPSWQYTHEQFATEPTRSKLHGHLERLITRDFNHPCIFAWSMGNESGTHMEEDEHGNRLRPVLESMYRKAKSLDDSRPITYTSGRAHKDLMFGIWDLVTVNIGLNWYKPGKQNAGNLSEALDAIRKAAGDKPIFIGETAGAGGIPGVRSLIKSKWTEDWQYENVQMTTQALSRRKDISGFCIWEFIDSRANPDRFMQRPREYNNKGMLDQYRRPKLAYDAAKRMFAELG